MQREAPPQRVCLVCGGQDLVRWSEATDVEYYSVPATYAYSLCANCESLSISPIPEDLGAIYPPTYYSFDDATRKPSVATRVKLALDRRLFRSIFQRIGAGEAKDIIFRARRRRRYRLASGAGQTSRASLETHGRRRHRRERARHRHSGRARILSRTHRRFLHDRQVRPRSDAQSDRAREGPRRRARQGRQHAVAARRHPRQDS